MKGNIYTGTGTSKPVKAKKSKATKTKDTNVFTDVQKKYLEPYGFTPDNMPKDFNDWSHKVSYEQASEILKSMGTSWGDPHPYQQLMKYYNVNLANNNSSIVTPITTTKLPVAKKPSVVKTISELGDLTIDNLDDYIATANSGSNKAYKTIEKMFSDNGFWLDDFLDDNDNIDSSSAIFKEAVAKISSKVTTTSTTTKKPTSTVSITSSSFDLASWKTSLSSNNTRDMDNWTKDWLTGITSDEKNGVYKYTSNAYMDMNGYLRGFRSSTNYEKEIRNCQAALAKASLPRETIVRRGSDYNMLDGLGIGKITQSNKSNFIGSIVGDKGFTSTSPDPHGGFSGDIEYVIKLPKGSQAMYVDSISRFSGEQELLINCDSKYIVEEVEFNSYGEVKKIYMTLINLQ